MQGCALGSSARCRLVARPQQPQQPQQHQHQQPYQQACRSGRLSPPCASAQIAGQRSSRRLAPASQQPQQPQPQRPQQPGRRSRPQQPSAFATPAAATPLQPSAGQPSGAPGGGGARLRRMILLRHADSEASSKLRDYERPISIQGKREALNIAKQLAALGWVPDLIIASNSRRTKQTLDTMAEAAAELAEVDAHFLGSLYTVAALDGQTKHHLEETIRSVACDARNFCVMCVGHNKGWEEAASAFAKQAVRLSTASAALFEVAGASWEDVTSPDADWRLVQVITP